MININFIRVTLLVLASLGMAGALPMSYLPFVIIPWGCTFIVAKATTMHTHIVGWVTLFTLAQAGVLLALVYLADVPLTQPESMPLVEVSLLGGALGIVFGLLGGLLTGIYYRWVRSMM